MTELRRHMIRDMNLAGFTPGTQERYIEGIRQLAKHYMLSPDQLTEKQVQDYVFYLREEKKVAKGTFQVQFSAMKFLYVNTLDCDWSLFTKKKSARLVRSPTTEPSFSRFRRQVPPNSSGPRARCPCRRKRPYWRAAGSVWRRR